MTIQAESIEAGSNVTNNNRYVPLLGNTHLRMLMSFVILILSIIISRWSLGNGQVGVVIIIVGFAWLLAVFFTDKYNHKYPQRYYTYLLAAHFKAAVIMVFLLLPVSLIAGPKIIPPRLLWTGCFLFVLCDVMISMLRKRDEQTSRFVANGVSSHAVLRNNHVSDNAMLNSSNARVIASQCLLDRIPPAFDSSCYEFIKANLPAKIHGSDKVLIIDDVGAYDNALSGGVELLIGNSRINDVRRLNIYLEHCVSLISMGGYLVLRYLPLENLRKNMTLRYKGIIYWVVYIAHFIWYRALPKIPVVEKLYFSPKISWLDALHLSIVKKRNRALAKAEVWGRLSFFGMNVLAESEGDGELFIIAQRVAQPAQQKVPSFFMVVSLEKVGLDGKIMHMHKIRTMYPFSEFLQKRIFEDHGLASTGKFANDFRLTDYGKFLRKYWLDELPQIFDWLRGDVKLVGMRATSPHFLSLYPQKLYDLYIQIKPGLIPPIFDEKTTGFEQIAAIELEYLESYKAHPITTDIRYFFRTFADIFLRGIRSK